MQRILRAALVLAAGFGLAEPVFGAAFTFQTVNAPGATGNTFLNGVNGAGAIVGNIGNTGSFLYANGSFISLNITEQSVVGPVNDAIANGINDSGVITGYSVIPLFQNVALGWTYSAGNLTNVISGELFGINNPGQLVGTYFNTSQGFPMTGGIVIGGANAGMINTVNGFAVTAVRGINDSGAIVLTTLNTTTGAPGPSYLDIGNVFTAISAPGASSTVTYGINNAGEIVGTYQDASGEHGFLDNMGVFTTIDVPGAASTTPRGINASGEIVGYYTDATGTHGFIASTVPEPASGMLVAAGIGLLIWKARGKREVTR